MKCKVIAAVLCSLGALWAADERTLSEDGKILTFNIPAGNIYTNMVAIESTF